VALVSVAVIPERDVLDRAEVGAETTLLFEDTV
jgi:hypothetical protein